MEKTAFRQLFNQFSGLISPYWQDLDNITNKWIDADTTLVPDHREKLKKGCFGSLIARFYPTASYYHLITSSRVMLFFFINDDNYHSATPEQLLPVHNSLIAALKGQPKDHNNLSEMLTEVRAELLASDRSEKWIARFINSMAFYLDGVRMEAPYRNDQNVPTLQEYFDIRSKSIGTDVCYDLIEFSGNFELPENTLQHPVICELKQLATTIIFLDNDLISIKKEEGDVMNTIIVLQHNNTTSREKAYQDTIHLRNSMVTKFETILIDITGSYFREDENVKSYVHGLKNMVVGNYCWQCLDSGRYTAKE